MEKCTSCDELCKHDILELCHKECACYVCNRCLEDRFCNCCEKQLFPCTSNCCGADHAKVTLTCDDCYMRCLECDEFSCAICLETWMQYECHITKKHSCCYFCMLSCEHSAVCDFKTSLDAANIFVGFQNLPSCTYHATKCNCAVVGQLDCTGFGWVDEPWVTTMYGEMRRSCYLQCIPREISTYNQECLLLNEHCLLDKAFVYIMWLRTPRSGFQWGPLIDKNIWLRIWYMSI